MKPLVMMVSYCCSPEQPVWPQQVALHDGGRDPQRERADHQDGAEDQQRAGVLSKFMGSLRLGLRETRRAIRPQLITGVGADC